MLHVLYLYNLFYCCVHHTRPSLGPPEITEETVGNHGPWSISRSKNQVIFQNQDFFTDCFPGTGCSIRVLCRVKIRGVTMIKTKTMILQYKMWQYIIISQYIVILQYEDVTIYCNITIYHNIAIYCNFTIYCNIAIWKFDNIYCWDKKMYGDISSSLTSDLSVTYVM